MLFGIEASRLGVCIIIP